MVPQKSRVPESSEPHDAAGGIDLTLIDAMLRLTPEERLEQNNRMITMAEELRAGLARPEGDDG